MQKNFFDKNHIGAKVKRVMLERNMDITQLAQKVNRSRTNMYDIFSRRSIDSSLLADLSIALNYNFFSALSVQVEEDIQKSL